MLLSPLVQGRNERPDVILTRGREDLLKRLTTADEHEFEFIARGARPSPISEDRHMRKQVVGEGVREVVGPGVGHGHEVAGFEATGKLNRKDFGLNWNQALESGGVLVGDEIKLSIEVEADIAS